MYIPIGYCYTLYHYLAHPNVAMEWWLDALRVYCICIVYTPCVREIVRLANAVQNWSDQRCWQLVNRTNGDTFQIAAKPDHKVEFKLSNSAKFKCNSIYLFFPANSMTIRDN